MPENTPTSSYFQQPDHAYWLPAEAPSLPPPPPVEYRGRFKKGFDPRRHQLTQADRSKGFWTAISRYGVGIGAKLHAKGRWPGFKGVKRAQDVQAF